MILIKHSCSQYWTTFQQIDRTYKIGPLMFEQLQNVCRLSDNAAMTFLVMVLETKIRLENRFNKFYIFKQIHRQPFRIVWFKLATLRGAHRLRTNLVVSLVAWIPLIQNLPRNCVDKQEAALPMSRKLQPFWPEFWKAFSK